MSVVRHITGGSLFVYQTQSSDFLLEGTDFAIHFSLGDLGSISMPAMGGPGAHISLSGMLAGDQTLRFGVVDYGGQVYPQLWFTGALNVHATAYTVPASSNRPVHHTSRFTLDGTLQAYLNNPAIGNPGPAVFDLQLKGKGKVTVRMSAAVSNVRSVTSYYYLFT